MLSIQLKILVGVIVGLVGVAAIIVLALYGAGVFNKGGTVVTLVPTTTANPTCDTVEMMSAKQTVTSANLGSFGRSVSGSANGTFIYTTDSTTSEPNPPQTAVIALNRDFDGVYSEFDRTTELGAGETFGTYVIAAADNKHVVVPFLRASGADRLVVYRPNGPAVFVNPLPEVSLPSGKTPGRMLFDRFKPSQFYVVLDNEIRAYEILPATTSPISPSRVSLFQTIVLSGTCLDFDVQETTLVASVEQGSGDRFVEVHARSDSSSAFARISGADVQPPASVDGLFNLGARYGSGIALLENERVLYVGAPGVGQVSAEGKSVNSSGVVYAYSRASTDGPFAFQNQWFSLSVVTPIENAQFGQYVQSYRNSLVFAAARFQSNLLPRQVTVFEVVDGEFGAVELFSNLVGFATDAEDGVSTMGDMFQIDSDPVNNFIYIAIGQSLTSESTANTSARPQIIIWSAQCK